MANKRKRTARAVAARATPEPVEPPMTGPAIVNSPEEAREFIRRMSSRKKRKVVYTEDALEGEDELAQVSTGKADDGFESPLTELGDDGPAADGEEEPVSPKKKRTRRKKNAEPVVYDIPPVETKTTTFKGRLGYACLNTVLRAMKPEPIFCSRTLRIDTILKPDFGMDYCKELGRKNTEDLAKLIQWNEDNNIRFLRVSSEMFPFASHDKYGYTLEYAEKELRAAGDLAKRYGHRLTTHPGQFTQLGSPRDVVVDAAIRDLEYHCQMFRYMGMNQDSVMIIHMGGMFGDKLATIERFKEVYRTRLSDEVKARLVLENDEMCYNADDLLPVCEELDIPIVFDYHHNWIYPSELPLPDLIARINAIWYKKGIKPKQHLSSPCPGAESVMEKRKHADRCYELPPELPDDMDLMIEAKDKEQAVFHLYRIYGLHPVIHENLRPEKPPKPFPRMVKEEAAAAAAAALEAGEPGEGADEAEGDGAATPRKRSAGTKTRSRAGAKNLKLVDSPGSLSSEVVPPTPRDSHRTSTEALEVLETGVAAEPKDLEDTADVEDILAGTPSPAKAQPVKSPRKRRTKATAPAASTEVPIEGADAKSTVFQTAIAEPEKKTKRSSGKKVGRKGRHIVHVWVGRVAADSPLQRRVHR
ncbi:UV-endonuclease UvdE-domain-containing protein [Trametes polyzona]|nr:UV-endonuclease UvdE-domain-containing protein [Trametes polyzona]